VEEYERIELGGLAEATLHGPAVSDVAHIVAELIENATQFSPPETSVHVDGARNGGSYQLVITDEGVGMPAEQLEQLNAVLRDPPVTGLALGRSLGCLVAARLAARHGITVRLRTGEGGGMAAYVILPRHLLVDAPVGPPVSTPEQALDPPLERPATLHEALPRADFEAGLQALLDRDKPISDPSEEPAVAPVEPCAPEPAAVAEPVAVGRPATEPPVHALTRRIPGATTEPLPEPPAMPPARRDPDQVRALLSRYRSGLEAGRRADGPADEERS
jgi:pimeloyl-ACP methyl ester carboxylesterase